MKNRTMQKKYSVSDDDDDDDERPVPFVGKCTEATVEANENSISAHSCSVSARKYTHTREWYDGEEQKQQQQKYCKETGRSKRQTHIHRHT